MVPKGVRGVSKIRSVVNAYKRWTVQAERILPRRLWSDLQYEGGGRSSGKERETETDNTLTL